MNNPKAVDIYTANGYLSKTINIAYTFDAPKEGAWGHTLQAADFKLIKDAGFTAVRLPIQWISRMNTEPPYNIDPLFLGRIDWAIAEALKNHLAIILDNHLDAQLMKAPATHRERFLSLWKQLSTRYQHRSQQVMFEVMAEPRGQLDAVWNEYFKEALAVIRETNPSRPVIVGPPFYNLVYHLADLKLPLDSYLIFTFHYYDPIQFTMQGETWFPSAKPEWVGTKWQGTEAEKNAINYTMDMVSDWANKNHRPVFLGEFGAGDHADSTSRALYFSYIRQQAEAHHFSWGIFNFAVDFSIYDQATKTWHQTLLKALIPAGSR
ncbi:glycoside hydrolase family 5 protein [Mucilaginibacter robiniae]|uniref:Glycoside hydrolase family 5 protein n=1 Tax=Mucilaginibacter robiniae TaxID=2728022 RepID=A0A7L5E361_9SPHI|nr:glycoside hydrolase family 5 protein [Mucilaginibacter robiniae]QJD97722.1 glycoside hydrolase family 5 protein [Mucilaginibacter robiniae]